MYKLICIDMDGTLLNSNHEVSEENKVALREATDKGVHIAITTGRVVKCASKYASILGINTPIISTNGAYISEIGREEAIYNNPMTIEELDFYLDIAEKYGLMTYFSTSEGVVTNKPLPNDHSYVVMNSRLEEADRVEILVVDDYREAFRRLDGRILKGISIDAENPEKVLKAKEEVSANKSLNVVTSWANNFEVMDSQSSKGDGVKKLAEFLNIKQEEVMCIGDSENDKSMLEYAGLGVAMGNATEEIKSISGYVTSDNNNSGVAKAIRKFVL